MARDYARRNGLELDETLTFHDLGVSAFRGQNLAEGRLAYFREAVREGLVPQGSFLLIEQLDRLSRLTPRLARRVLEDIIEGGITVVTLNDERQYSLETIDDPIDLLVTVMTFMRANEESATKSRRLLQAWEGKRSLATTKPLTSRVPAWLRLVPETGKIELIPERAKLIQRIFAMTLDGVGQHKIAETFNREGLKPWGSAKHWQRSYIAKILSNPAVVGTMTPHLMVHEGGSKRRKALEPLEAYYPPVVSQQTWSDVRAQQEAGRSTGGRFSSAPISNILARLAACPLCGRTMTRVQKGKKSKPSLVCTAAKAGAGCLYRSVPYDRVEDAVLRGLPPRLEASDGIDLGDGLEQEIVNADQLVDHLKETASNLLDNLSHEVSPALATRLRDTERDLEEAQARLQGLLERRDAASGPLVSSRIARALKALQPTDGHMQPAVANAALRGIFKRAVVNWPEGTVDLEWTHGGLCVIPYGLRTLSAEPV
jgi:DNA invertase Pin-like site-specific DNA recombinase